MTKTQEEMDTETVPLPQGLKIGLTYNLKKGIKKETVDSEAELDNIETIDALKAVFTEAGAEVILMEADETLPKQLMETKVDLVFNIAEGLNGRGREAQVPALLDMYQIPYTGSDATTLSIALDKALTKRLLSTYHVATPHYFVIHSANEKIPSKLVFPVIVKPNAEGSSKGISDVSVVANGDDLSKLANHCITAYHQDMLAEEYIEGREFTVGLLGNGEDVRAFCPMEIIYQKETQDSYHVYSYQVKQNYKKFIKYECPSKIEEKIQQQMMHESIKIFKALGCKDFARIDFRVSKDGKISFIEINPLPGLAPGYSDYPMLAEFCGMDYKKLVLSILEAACKRYGILPVKG